MLDRMQQQGEAQRQQTFNAIMQQSIQKSGAQVDPQDIPGSLGQIIANAMVATIGEAKSHNKQVPPPVVLQSAADLIKQALSQFQLEPQDLDAMMSRVFAVAIDSFLALSQGTITPEERNAYEQFMQRLAQELQANQGQQGQQAQGGM